MVKATLQLWSLAQVKGRLSDATGAVGQCVVHGKGGQTTVIKAVDAVKQTITTESGSVYALGVPNALFAVKRPDLMRELGFM